MMFGSYKVYFKLGIIHFICSNQEDIRITKPLPHTANSKKIQNESWGCKDQKQPCRGVLRKRCSEDMQQIYKRTPMPKCEKIAFRHGCSPVNLLHIFRTSFAKNTSGRLPLKTSLLSHTV